MLYLADCVVGKESLASDVVQVHDATWSTVDGIRHHVNGSVRVALDAWCDECGIDKNASLYTRLRSVGRDPAMMIFVCLPVASVRHDDGDDVIYRTLISMCMFS